MTLDGYKPTSELLEVIEEVPTPTNLNRIRSWFDLVNQAGYAFTETPTMFCKLLKHNSTLYQDDTLDRLIATKKRISYGK